MDKNPLPTINKVNFSTQLITLETATKDDFLCLQSWFTHKRQVLLWAGPTLAYPSSFDNFILNLTQANFMSFALKSDEHMIGFGQCQIHKQHMHLGRLAVHPQCRGKGLSYTLMNKMIEQGEKLSEQPLKTVSLFVYTANKTACKAYNNMGFVVMPTPAGITTIKGCEYMLMYL